MKKKYESSKLYSKKYNKENINVQLNRDIIEKIRFKLKGISLKDYIEKILNEQL